MLSNTITNCKGRVDSDRSISLERRDELVEEAKALLRYDQYHEWNANINGVIVQLRTNDVHLYDFWVDNWYPAPLEGDVQPHGRIYAVTGIPDRSPFAYYHSETRTAIFHNTNYYGQCKSWALGIVADICERQLNTHSIHGACVDINGRGVVIIAPTGTGKSTHSYGLLSMRNARFHSDDWLYLKYAGGKDGRANAFISERKFYMRTDIAERSPRLRELFDRCKCENVVTRLEDCANPHCQEKADCGLKQGKGYCYWAYGNSRALLDPYWIGGDEQYVRETRIKVVILLRRDQTSPPEVELGSDEAIAILEEGRYQVLEGAGGGVGSFQYEPFYNPYLLARSPERTERQKRFFRQLFCFAGCYIMNTGVESVQESQERIRRIASQYCYV